MFKKISILTCGDNAGGDAGKATTLCNDIQMCEGCIVTHTMCDCVKGPQMMWFSDVRVQL